MRPRKKKQEIDVCIPPRASRASRESICMKWYLIRFFLLGGLVGIYWRRLHNFAQRRWSNILNIQHHCKTESFQDRHIYKTTLLFSVFKWETSKFWVALHFLLFMCTLSPNCSIDKCFLATPFQAPFTVHLHIGALFVVDAHSHCSHDTEVMGLLGGELREDSLHIIRAVSCQASLSSSTHCDMCPGN